MRTVTRYRWHTGKLEKTMKLAVVSDLHDQPYEDIWPLIKGCDCLLVPGDVVCRYTQGYTKGITFLRDAAQRLPTFYSVGNHEMKLRERDEVLAKIADTGVTMLLNQFVHAGGLCIGGWYPASILKKPDMLPEFEQQSGCKILMCHKPEHYRKYIRGHQVDLVLAGHAHGGQIRIGDRGLYAPGQGLFPRYTKGVVDGKMIVSTGASNSVWVPRWGNPCEILRIAID